MGNGEDERPLSSYQGERFCICESCNQEINGRE